MRFLRPTIICNGVIHRRRQVIQVNPESNNDQLRELRRCRRRFVSCGADAHAARLAGFIADRPTGSNPAFRAEDTALGEALPWPDLGLCMAVRTWADGRGSRCGTAAGGEVMVSCPMCFPGKEIAHNGLPRSRRFRPMHERKGPHD